MSNWIVANKLDHEIDLKSNSVLNFNIKENASACLFFNSSDGVDTATINVKLGKNSSCELLGFFKCNNKNTKIFTNIMHNGNKSKCTQDFRFVNKHSTSAFEGTITIPRNVSKCESHMLNKNILLDDYSQAFSKPELNINNDDVICTHGCTMGALEDDHMFYLQSRGFTYDEATEMLIEAFGDIKKRDNNVARTY